MEFFKLLISVIALKHIRSIFDNDDHFIVSERGYKILNRD